MNVISSVVLSNKDFSLQKNGIKKSFLYIALAIVYFFNAFAV